MTLRITLEIIPHGDEANKRIIETINISNLGYVDMNYDNDTCEYVIEHNKYKEYTKDDPRMNHSRSDGAIKLSYQALQHLYYSKLASPNDLPRTTNNNPKV